MGTISKETFAEISQLLNLGLAECRVADAKIKISEWSIQENIQLESDLALTLKSNPLAVQRLIDKLVVGETYFFRHEGHFVFIRQEVERDDLRNTKQYEVLSAGCSTGEEAYSCSMLLEQAGVQYTVRGIDISSENIRNAKEGNYSSWSLRNINAFSDLTTYLREYKNGKHSVTDEVKKQTLFQCENLLKSSEYEGGEYSNRFDFILCRNLMIYLQPADTNDLAFRLIEMLKPGGWLIPGPSDPITTYLDLLMPKETTDGLVFQKPVTLKRNTLPSNVNHYHPSSIDRSVSVLRRATKIPSPTASHRFSINTRNTNTSKNEQELGLTPHNHELIKAKIPVSMEPEIYFQEALKQWEGGNLSEAENSLTKALYLEPVHPVYIYFKAMCYLALNKKYLAKKQFLFANKILSSSEISTTKETNNFEDLRQAINKELIKLMGVSRDKQ
ncbi:methyltransferase domain-containing protein [Alteromonas sp. 345S023]|uniref:Methyltransferase domain-containing protein n=1 Tax=Alteromonas profundi TaxID=2696062 RepID=A0A7X5RLS3_9ALTE|nr:CheR family methyltransferase [Alteromonas profundi]NDV92024.1 methyltransferase domain-containing protein [Alteromonas profundi]